jgi:hypothetical protein
MSKDALTTLDNWFLNRKTANCSCYFNFAGDSTVYPAVTVSSESYMCSACPGGQFRNSSNNVHDKCKKCPAGQFQETPGQTSCKLCVAGKQQENTGSTECNQCQAATYAQEKGQAKCVPCPYGGSCDGGIAAARMGFWRQSAKTKDATISFHRCPGGYCTNTSIASEGCAENRIGVLCGDCAPGFAQAIGGVSCRNKNHCNDAAWAIFVGLALSCCFAYYALKAGARKAGKVWGFPINSLQVRA